MAVKRFAVAVAFSMLCAGVVRADMLQPDDTFTVDFFAENGSWESDASFNAVASSTFQYGFTQNQLCPDGDWERCICDPGVKVNVPDPPPPPLTFDGSTMFSLTDGTFDQNYINNGPDFTTLIFSTMDFEKDETYTCSSDFFEFCGFKVEDNTLYIEFSDPKNHIGVTTAPTPEPRQYVWLLIAGAGVVALRRYRSRRGFILN
jgi:hypothetical protein